MFSLELKHFADMLRISSFRCTIFTDVLLLSALFQYNIVTALENNRSFKFQKKYLCNVDINAEDVFSYQHVKSKLVCAKLCCDDRYRCVAYDVIRKSGNTYTCRLRDKPLPELCSSPVSDQDAASYYEKEAVLIEEEETTTLATTTTANPCLNGGTYSSGVCVCDTGCSGVNCEICYKDCMEGNQNGKKGLVPAWIQPSGFPTAFKILCYFDYGISYIQYRKNGNVDFNRSWSEYENGFGDLNGDFWLGNKFIYALIQQKTYQLGLKFFTSTWMYAKYSSITMYGPNDDYRIEYGSHILGPNILSPSNTGKRIYAQTFKTYDNDVTGCAMLEQSGWWFNTLCSESNINKPTPFTVDGYSGITLTKMGLF